MKNPKIADIVEKLQNASQNMPKAWDGKSAILEMKEAGSTQWRQMEWMGFYFEFLCETRFDGIVDMPGRKYGNTTFDAFCEISWDFKTHAANAKTSKYKVVANDVEAMNSTLDDYGYYGMILATGEVEYNDEDRTLKKWHDELKGEISQYRKKQMGKGGKHRVRKTGFILVNVHFICLNHETLNECGSLYHQGKNSNGEPRPPKYNIDIRVIPDAALVATQNFQ